MLKATFAASLTPRVTFVKGTEKQTLGYKLNAFVVYDTLLNVGWKVDGGPSPKVFADLITWATSTGRIPTAERSWWDAMRTLRNQWAHGNSAITTPHMPLMVLRDTIWKINALFPDPETSAHDRQRAQEETGKPWWFGYISRTD